MIDLTDAASSRNPNLFGWQDLSPDTPDRYPDHAGSKVGGTSAEAARAIEPLACRLRRDVLAEFLAAGDCGLTADQAAKNLGRSPLAIRPRCSELKASGLLEETALRRPNPDSRLSAAVLRATSKAREVQ